MQGWEDYKRLHADQDPACDIIMKDDFIESFIAGAPLIVLNNYLKESSKPNHMKKSSLIPRHHQPRHTDHIPSRKYDMRANWLLDCYLVDIENLLTETSGRNFENVTSNPATTATATTTTTTTSSTANEVTTTAESSTTAIVNITTASTVYWKSVRATTLPRQPRKMGQARGLKKLCAMEAHRDTNVCRRYRLNLKFADRRQRRSTTAEVNNSEMNINTELMRKFNWIPKMLDQVVNSNATVSNRKMTQSMNVIAREILGPVHTAKIIAHTEMKAFELRQTCIANGTVEQPSSVRKTRTYQRGQVETQLRGVYNVGKDVSWTEKPTIKDIKPGERFKAEDTTLISLLGLLLGNSTVLTTVSD